MGTIIVAIVLGVTAVVVVPLLIWWGQRRRGPNAATIGTPEHERMFEETTKR